MTRQPFPAILVRIGTPILGTEQWALLSKNTDEVVTTALKRPLVEQFAKEHGYKVTKVVNDYN